MNVVLFLGAGFSRAIGLPVVSEFFDHVNQNTTISAEDKEFLQRLRQKAREGVSMLSGANNDLEHILSFALMSMGLNRSSGNKDANEYGRLCLILHQVYRVLQPGKLNQMRDRISRAMGTQDAWRGSRLTVITTNYDLVPEFFFRQNGFPLSLPCAWKRIGPEDGSAGLYARLGPFTVCKLHGSLNWFDDPSTPDLFLVEDRILSGEHFTASASFESIVMPSVSYTKYQAPRPPVIVPPTLFKMQTDTRFDPIWQTAAEALRAADRLTFVGYSFPKGDIHMRYFLAANLVGNTDLRRIDVVDPRARAVVDALKDNPDLGPHFKDLLTPQSVEWETSGLTLAPGK